MTSRYSGCRDNTGQWKGLLLFKQLLLGIVRGIHIETRISLEYAIILGTIRNEAVVVLIGRIVWAQLISRRTVLKMLYVNCLSIVVIEKDLPL